MHRLHTVHTHSCTYTHTTAGEGWVGFSCRPDGPSHAADRPTLLDPRQPGSTHTALLQT